MELLIFDSSNRSMKGIVESYEYLNWNRKYSRCGSFELKAIANSVNVELLTIGSLVWKNDDNEAGIIEFLEFNQGETEFITVSGRFLTSLLSRRIVWGTETLNGDISDCIATLLDHHLLNPAMQNRKIPRTYFSHEQLGIPVNTQISYENLMTAVCDICENADIGIRITFVASSGVFNIELYRGLESQAVFSKEYENLIEQVYTTSVAEYSNVALVNGFTAMTIVGSESGTDRREIFVDAQDLKVEDFPDTYDQALLFRGNSKLAENAVIKAFDVTVNQYGNLKYKTDFDVGSLIKAQSKKWNIAMTARITGVSETYDKTGMSLDLTFGKPLLTLAERIRRV
jgi:hypothetical protein